MTVKTKFDYEEKFARVSATAQYEKLPERERIFLKEQAFVFKFSQQELHQLCVISNDLLMWKELDIVQIWPFEIAEKKKLITEIQARYGAVQSKPKRYMGFSTVDKPKAIKPKLVNQAKPSLGLGYCPVASEKTRCCNLLTLDSVERCGFDCSYCSIQSFYHENEVRFDIAFAEKLSNLVLDPAQTYHIGTGQSSDSLMWGNHNGNLVALCEFAEKHPNVILEFKTKSKNIAWLLEHGFPANIICTWSLNPQEIIDYEEHQTADLKDRIRCARRVADKGRLVGFHFHPMIWYENSDQAYASIAKRLLRHFKAREVAMVSMGSLTYTKDIMRTIRARKFYSKILQMPLQQVAGKFSYPDEIKTSLFKNLYACLEDWHQDVFFYLCMEPAALWQPVFGTQAYASNEAFERAMKAAYLTKIKAISAV